MVSKNKSATAGLKAAENGASVPIIEAVRSWLAGFDGFCGEKLNVDFLPPESNGYSVDVMPVESVIMRYLDGSSVRQFDFVIAMRGFWGEDVRLQMENLGFFERLAEWLEQKSLAGELPDLGAGRVCRKVEVSASGYVFAPEESLARYQMQCKLVYRQEAAVC